MTRSLALTALIALTTSAAFAQTPPDVSALATRSGHEITVSVQHYKYVEPPPVDISIHGPKVGAEYTGTFLFSEQRRWFGQLNLRGTVGNADYDGNCRPWLIVPSSSSANGYRLTLGAQSPCSESGDSDWYVEGRFLAGKDFVRDSWAISPFSGLGVRHLSNGVTGNFNFRTDEYLYIPLGATFRTTPGAARVLTLTAEYDRLLRGWQTTRNSLLGGGTLPATDVAPSFSIGNFTDISFDQHSGWALRLSANYQLNRSWSIEPYYLRWHVGASPVNAGTVALTVNSITVLQPLSFYEPINFTNEFGVKVGLRLGKR